MSVRVRFRDLSLPDEERVRLLEAIDALMRRGTFILGDTVEEFEAEFARRCQQPHAIGVSDGTGALYLSLRALGVGACRRGRGWQLTVAR